jgi:hypothetical protein
MSVFKELKSLRERYIYRGVEIKLHCFFISALDAGE